MSDCKHRNVTLYKEGHRCIKCFAEFIPKKDAVVFIQQTTEWELLDEPQPGHMFSSAESEHYRAMMLGDWSKV